MTRYRGSLDRTGWALALGGACVGTGVLLSGWVAGEGRPGTLALLWLTGAVLGLVVIAGVGWPVWRLVTRSGRRGPVAAGVTGAAVGGVAALGVITQGSGWACTRARLVRCGAARWRRRRWRRFWAD